MAKKTTPVEKAARMLDLVPYISSHQGISLSDLARDFDVQVDELVKDLTSLWMCGDSRFDLMDLEFESGYVTIRNAQTLNRVRSLSHQEKVSIVIGLSLLQEQLRETRPEFVSIISSLQAKLAPSEIDSFKATSQVNPGIFRNVMTSLQSSSKLEIEYLSTSDGELSTRTISPLHVTHQDGRDFLQAYCELAQGVRTFRLDHIQSAKPIDSSALPNSQTIEAQEPMSVGVVLIKDKRRGRESLGNRTIDNGEVVNVSVFSSSWMVRTVLSSAGAMAISSKGEMRNLVQSKVDQILALYR